MSRSPVVLSIGRDIQSLAYRDKVLTEAGYVVVEASSAPEIVEKVFDTDFDVAVICSSVPAEERIKITRILKLHKSNVPVLVISAFEGQHIPPGVRTVSTDPQLLVPALGHAVEQGHSPAWTSSRTG